MQDISLDTARPYWEVDGPETFVDLFNVFQGWLPKGAVMYFEDGSPDAEIEEFMGRNAIPEQSHVAVGTVWPRPMVFHVPATPNILSELARIMEHHAEPELAIHFHVYRDNSLFLEWHDAFYQPMLLSGAISEEQVRVFAVKAGKQFRKMVEITA